MIYALGLRELVFRKEFKREIYAVSRFYIPKNYSRGLKDFRNSC